MKVSVTAKSFIISYMFKSGIKKALLAILINALPLSSFAALSPSVSSYQNRTFDKMTLLTGVNAWIYEAQKQSRQHPEILLLATQLKNRLERETDSNFTLTQIEDILGSIQETFSKKSFAHYLKQTSIVISHAEPGEDPVSLLKQYSNFYAKDLKGASEFEETRNYTNKSISLTAHPASLDEAASAVESKIFKDNTDHEESEDDMI